MSSLHAIVYLSSAVRLYEPAQIERLLNVARLHNAAEDVTGLLLYDNGNFMQYIEGPPDGLRRIYTRIQHDPTHHQIVVLLDEPITEREFGDWSMGYNQGTMPAILTSPLGARQSPGSNSPATPRRGQGEALIRSVWSTLVRASS